MVALALGAVISVMISVVSTQARDAYSKTVDKVGVYSNFRLVYSALQRDLSGWIPTAELEFYNDGRGGRKRDFHWQPGEEVPDRSDKYGPGAVDGGTKGKYDEYAFIEQGHYESQEPSQILAGDMEFHVHDAYRVYFRTLTYVNGEVREANVEYMLVDTSVPQENWQNGLPPMPVRVKPGDVANLALYKVVRYNEISESTIQLLNSNPPPQRAIIEIATNVTDFRVEYMTQNPFENHVTARFVTPEQDFAEPAEEVTRPRRIERTDGGPGQIWRKRFGYGSIDITEKFPLATAYSAFRGDDGIRAVVDHRPVRFGFSSSNQIQFAELAAGDRIYVFTPSAIAGGGNVNVAGGGSGGVSGFLRFPAGDYSIRANLGGLLEFEEDVDTSAWQGRDQSPLYYKAAFLPSALRVTIRMVDDSGREPKTMQQVIWLRRKSR
jgi:hypothetical protein